MEVEQAAFTSIFPLQQRIGYSGSLFSHLAAGFRFLCCDGRWPVVEPACAPDHKAATRHATGTFSKNREAL